MARSPPANHAPCPVIRSLPPLQIPGAVYSSGMTEPGSIRVVYSPLFRKRADRAPCGSRTAAALSVATLAVVLPACDRAPPQSSPLPPVVFAGPKDYRGSDTVCPLHRQPLYEDVVPIHHGRVSFTSPEGDARNALFPFSHSYVQEGCVVEPGGPVRALVRCCATCRSAEKEWRASQPQDGG